MRIARGSCALAWRRFRLLPATDCTMKWHADGGGDRGSWAEVGAGARRRGNRGNPAAGGAVDPIASELLKRRGEELPRAETLSRASASSDDFKEGMGTVGDDTSGRAPAHGSDALGRELDVELTASRSRPARRGRRASRAGSTQRIADTCVLARSSTRSRPGDPSQHDPGRPGAHHQVLGEQRRPQLPSRHTLYTYDVAMQRTPGDRRQRQSRVVTDDVDRDLKATLQHVVMTTTSTAGGASTWTASSPTTWTSRGRVACGTGSEPHLRVGQ